MTEGVWAVGQGEGEADLHTWGHPYGHDGSKRPGTGYRTPTSIEVWLYRKGQKCRWFDRGGHQWGPEQANVAPALAYAFSQHWRPAAWGRSDGCN